MAAVRGTTVRGLYFPPSGCFVGADDGQAGAGEFTGTHGIETAYTPNALTGGMGQRLRVHRRHYSSSSWSSDGSGTMRWGNGTKSGKAMGVAERADALMLTPPVIPCIVLGSQGPSFPVKQRTWVVNGSSHTSESSNTATVKGLQGMERIAGGEFDVGLVQLANTIKGIVDGSGNKIPVLLVPWQEMNIPAMNCGGGYQGGPLPYQHAVQHLRDVLDTNGAENALIVFCPTQYDPLNNKMTYYPGDTACQVEGIDLYSVKFAGNVDDIYNHSVAHNKPFGAFETGFAEGTGNQGLSKAAVIAEHQASAKSAAYAPNTLFYLIWNQFFGSVDFTYYSSRAAYDAYYTFFTQDAYYQIARGVAGPSPPPPPPPGPPPPPPPPPAIHVVAEYGFTASPLTTAIADDSGHGLTATAINMGTNPVTVPGPSGRDPRLVFDGTRQQRLEVADPQGLLKFPTAWAIMCFAELAAPVVDTDPVHQRWECFEKANDWWLNVRMDTSPQYLVRTGGFFGPGATFTKLDSAAPIVPGTEYHLAAVYTGSQLRVVINGVTSSTLAVSGVSQTQNEKLVIGCKHQAVQTPAIIEAFWNGTIREPRFFGQALTDAEIQDIMATPISPPLVAPLWPGPMVITGAPQVGKVLHANPGTPQGIPAPDVSWEWWRR